MYKELEKLQSDLVPYREVIDHVFTGTLATSGDWQKWLREIAICASQLCVDYLLVVKYMPELEAVASKRGALDLVQSDGLRGKSQKPHLVELLSGQRIRSPNSPAFTVCKTIPINYFCISPKCTRRLSQWRPV
jgi:hypothetical protein